MKLTLVHRPAAPASVSPYRLVDDLGQEIPWANAFLDAQRIRQLSLRSLRAYGYDLLHFARWWLQHPPRPLLEMDESTLLDYARDQLNAEPKPTPQTINHRLGVLRSLYRFHSGHADSCEGNKAFLTDADNFPAQRSQAVSCCTIDRHQSRERPARRRAVVSVGAGRQHYFVSCGPSNRESEADRRALQRRSKSALRAAT